MKKLVLVIAVLLVVPVMLVGCARSDSDAIKGSLNGFAQAFNDEDFEKCTEYLLGIDDATKEIVKASLSLGHGLGGDITGESVEVVSVDGSTAVANVTFSFMSIEQTRKVTLNKVDGTWKFGLGDLLSAAG